jgi:hypothetical protein
MVLNVMKPLVLQFQEDLLSGKKSIGDLLRMAKMISAKLGQGDVYDWFNHERDIVKSCVSEMGASSLK